MISKSADEKLKSWMRKNGGCRETIFGTLILEHVSEIMADTCNISLFIYYIIDIG